MVLEAEHRGARRRGLWRRRRGSTVVDLIIRHIGIVCVLHTGMSSAARGPQRRRLGRRLWLQRCGRSHRGSERLQERFNRFDEAVFDRINILFE